MIKNDAFDAVEQRLDSTFFLLLRNDIENLNPALSDADQQMADVNRRAAGSGFQATRGFYGDDYSARQRYQPIRAMFYLLLTEIKLNVHRLSPARLVSPE